MGSRIVLVRYLRSEGTLSQISIEDRGSALGLRAAIRRVLHERQLWAVSTKHRPHAKGLPKVSSKQQKQSVPKLSLSAQRH
jgi:hypothetical protein